MKKFIKEYQEVWALPLVAIVWIVVRPPVLKWLGKDNVPLPDDTLQLLFFSVITIISANFFALLGIRLNFPRLYKWYKKTNIDEAKITSELSQRDALWFYVVYCTHVLGFILGVSAIT